MGKRRLLCFLLLGLMLFSSVCAEAPAVMTERETADRLEQEFGIRILIGDEVTEVPSDVFVVHPADEYINILMEMLSLTETEQAWLAGRGGDGFAFLWTRKEAALKWKERFAQAVGDDLNVPAALGLLHSAVRDDAVSEEERGALVLDFDRVLGLKLDREEEAAPAAAEDSEAAEIDALVAERAAAKKAKDFARADEIRNALAKRGIELKDGPQGTTWERRR